MSVFDGLPNSKEVYDSMLSMVIVMLCYVSLSLPHRSWQKDHWHSPREYDNQQSGIMLKYACTYAPSTSTSTFTSIYTLSFLLCFFFIRVLVLCLIKVIKALVNCFKSQKKLNNIWKIHSMLLYYGCKHIYRIKNICGLIHTLIKHQHKICCSSHAIK